MIGRGYCPLASAVALTLSLIVCEFAPAAEAPPSAATLRALDSSALPKMLPESFSASRMVQDEVRGRLRSAVERENRAWAEVKTKADWEKFRAPRLEALRRSLGTLPKPGSLRELNITGEYEGEDYVVQNVTFNNPLGLIVTGNLYLPRTKEKDEPAAASRPGILISHSHHAPKTDGELQDMGVTWARSGSVVLVLDHLGHGERAQHPFRSDRDFPKPFRAGRQDYYFRYNLSLQLQASGESLMGQLVGDLMLGVDVLVAQKGVDPKRIILLGAVAGGGDPAAVTAALDERIAAVAPFNFGGTQPDYTTPENAQRDFYWFGVPYWETTRCLPRGAAGGFAQWFIVASVAPRRVIYGHEFAWDEARDPAWPRIKKVFELHEAKDNLATAQGQGNLKGKEPESSHCNHIGKLHRSRIYPHLERWFKMPAPEEQSARRDKAELAAITPEVAGKLRPKPLHEILNDRATNLVASQHVTLVQLKPHERRQRLRKDWATALGDVDPDKPAEVKSQSQEVIDGATVHRITLETEPGILVPVLLIVPKGVAKPPVAMIFGILGKKGFLELRAEAAVHLLAGGVAICVPDLRGFGETRFDNEAPTRGSTTTNLSVMHWLLGDTLLAARLRDLRSTLAYLKTRRDVDATQVAMWGGSPVEPNPMEMQLALPLDVDGDVKYSEPVAGLLAVLAALFEDDVRVVASRGSFAAFSPFNAAPFLYVPHDGVVPGAFAAGDLPELAASLAPRPMRIEAAIGGRNRRVPTSVMREMYAPAEAEYRKQRAGSNLVLTEDRSNPDALAEWLVKNLKAGTKR